MKTKTALDYETKSSCTVIVAARDGNGGRADVTVAIDVIDVNEDQSLLERYDDNNNRIDKDEAITAVEDYLFGDGSVTKAHAIKVIELYLFG